MISDCEIKLINKIIFEAIKHGGDSGGPYLTNEDGLVSKINNLLYVECMTDEYEVREVDIEDDWCGTYPNIHQIVEKRRVIMKEEIRRVMFSDEDHVWIDGNKQFISLNRFLNLRDVMDKECRLLMDKIKELSKENEAMKVLLNIK